MPANNARATVYPPGRLKRWAATLIATFVSSYALDTVCTVAGVALVASGAFSGLDVRGAIIVLAFSYALWAGGLTTSLAANWRLLEATGTSTNALSKLAHDLAARWSGRLGIRRRLSAAGYVAFELAKEWPYYIGAFGLAVASDAVSGAEALIFLAGANVGAAAFEYGLGRSTRVFLEKGRLASHASFEEEWKPSAYLSDYYRAVEADEKATIAFFVAAARRMPVGEPALVFGTGPTLHHVFLLTRCASEIHLGDYLCSNLAELARWLRQEAGAHDWQPFIAETLECEGEAADRAAVLAREQLTRSRITALLEVDVRNDRCLDGQQGHYGMVLSAYCADSMTGSLADWQIYMRRIVRLVRPGGMLLVAALGHAHSYVVGGKLFPSPCLSSTDMEELLRASFPEAELTIRTVAVPECAPHGYAHIILAAVHPVPMSRRSSSTQEKGDSCTGDCTTWAPSDAWRRFSSCSTRKWRRDNASAPTRARSAIPSSSSPARTT